MTEQPLLCRLKIHKWANPEEVRDDSIATASGNVTLLAAYRYVYTCKRCGIDSDTHYGYTNQGKTGR